MGLCDGLNDPNKKGAVVSDCIKLIDELVAAKKGLSGFGLKASYSAVKGVAPSYYAGAVERLVPEAFTALDPMWNEGVKTGSPVEYFVQNSSRAADALLGVTDAKIEKSQSRVVKGAYKQLRSSAKGDVEDAIPGLAKIIDNYTKA